MSFTAYETSSAQKRLYIINHLLGDSLVYNENRVWTVKGNLDPDRLKKAIEQICHRHETLRTCFVMKDGEVLQKVFDHIDVDFKYLQAKMTESSVNDLEALIDDFLKPYNLGNAPLWKIALVEWEQNRQSILMDFHHILADGISMDLIMEELGALYLMRELPEPEVQYVDFVIWQNDFLNGEGIRKQETYWLKMFEGDIPVLELPTDFARPQEVDIAGTSIDFELDDGLTAGVNKLAASYNTTLYVVLLSIFNILLSKYTNQEDIIVGTPVSGRPHLEFEKVIGMFVNTLAMRNQPEGGKTFIEFLSEVSKNAFNAFENQDYQFEMLVEKVAANRQLNRNPLFDVMFALQNFSRDIDLSGDGAEELHIIPYHYKRRAAKFDLTIQAFEVERRISFMLDYRTSLFRPETIERLTKHFLNIFREVTENPEILISDIQVISESEKEQLLYEFNDTTVEFPVDKTISQLFEEQVRRTPDRIAVFGHGVTRTTTDIKVGADSQICPITLSYNELNEQSGRLAGLLIEKGVLVDSIIGIMVDRSINTIIGIMSILKAGGAYLPIDPDYPRERIDYMLKDSAAKIMIGRAEFVFSTFFPASLLPRFLASDMANLAYIIYTSGSTGRPKGVMVEQRNLVNLVYGLRERIYSKYNPNPVVALVAPYIFDASVKQIFAALLLGGSLYIIPEDVRFDGEKLYEYYMKHVIDMSDGTPTHLRLLMESRGGNNLPLNIKCFLIGGEPLTWKVVEKLFAQFDANSLKIQNVYGPTECCVDSTTCEISKENLGLHVSLPIGGPMPNQHVYIVSKVGNLQPLGVPGELCIGGNSVSRGYLNNPELTAEKFNRSNKSYRTYILYKTGDLARWLVDPTAQGAHIIEFLGRSDQQVKIRGFRIETGEIENILLKNDKIKEAMVLVKEDEEGNPYICAYVVGKDRAAFDKLPPMELSKELKEYLSGMLPDYMIPSFFVKMEAIPVTSQGKVDRKSLPEPEKRGTAAYTAPRDAIEEKLVEIWSDVLNIKRKDTVGETGGISIDDNFFELGGHSLRAAVLLARMHKELDVAAKMADIFKMPTIRGISDYIRTAVRDKLIAIDPVEKKEYYPLSSAQNRLYILQQMDPGGTVYNIPIILHLHGELDNRKLEEIFRLMILRHESLRTSFIMVNEESVQRIHDEVEFKIEVLGFRDQYPGFINFIRPFELSRAPLMRVALVKESKRKHILMVDIHHIVTDGVAMELLIREFKLFYLGKESSPLRVQYKDYACWQNSAAQKEVIRSQETYWLEQFSGEIPVLELPTDFPRPAVQSFEGRQVRFEIPAAVTKDLKGLAAREGGTLYMALLAVTTIFLAKITSQEDILVGTPVAGRRHVDLERIIGMFVNTLVMRNFLVGTKRFSELFKEVKQGALAAFENQEYQFEDLVERVMVNRDPGHNPLFDVIFALQNIQDQPGDITETELHDLEIKPYEREGRTAKFDMTLLCFEGQDGLLFTLEYCTKLFKEETIIRFINYYRDIIPVVISNPEVKIADIEIITEEEKRLILEDFNNTETAFPADKTVHELFENQVEKAPNHISVIGSTVETLRATSLQITYRQLNEQSNRLAQVLIEKGVLADDIIGIMLERSIEMIIGILGILKSGSAYLSIDPGYPQERLEYMLRESGTKLLIVKSEIRISKFETNPNDQNTNDQNKNQNLGIPFVLNFENLNFEFVSSFGFRASDLFPSNLAYVIYTSGSTGKPKGVMVEHRNVVRLVKNTNYVEFRENDRLLQTGALEFDASTFEIWGSLLNGLTLYLVPKEDILMPEQLKLHIRRYDICTIWLTSSLFNQLVQMDVEIFVGLRNLLVGGDVLSPKYIGMVRERFPGLNIINGYGPTENTTFSTTYRINRQYESRIPIGSPIANSTAFVVDKTGHLAPVGIAGELWVGGDGVVRGYLNNPELTEQKFLGVQGPFFKKVPGRRRLYKTGDLARWLVTGDIEFLGRIDQQVKIRGFRVELGEIETELMKHESVKDAVVIDKKDERGEIYLCCYIVLKKEFNLNGLKEYLAGRLPGYMIPAHFIGIESIPLTANGKVDRKALPAPGVIVGDVYEAPSNEIEENLVGLWSEILAIEKDKISVTANFFALGGHSLKATVLTAKIHKAFDIKFTLTDIFRFPTIRESAQYIKSSARDKYETLALVEKMEYYGVSSAQKRLFVLWWMNKGGVEYNITFPLELEGRLDKAGLESTFRRLIQRHESLRTSFEMGANEPVQKVHDEVEFIIENYNESAKEGENIHHSSFIIHHFIRAFDLSKAPLLRVGLIRMADDRHILVVDMHHIISDGMSTGILIKEFTALQKGKELPALRLQYKDFAQWQRNQVYNVHQEYWLRQFGDEIPVLNLPYDYTRPAVQSFEGMSIQFELGKEETSSLILLGIRENATLFMVLAALFNVLLSKLSGQEDIVVGTPVTGRSHPDLETIMGMFVNTLALRNYPCGQKTFREFLKELREGALGAFAHQEYPFEELLDRLTVARDAGRNPLFDVMFVMQDLGWEELAVPGLKIKPYRYRSTIAKFDMMLEAVKSEDKLFFELNYAVGLFKEETIRRYIGYFLGILGNVLENPDRPISRLEIISPDEKRRILEEFNDTETLYPADKTIHELFERQVERTPDRIAVFGHGLTRTTLSYNELNEQSGRLAYLLIEKGVLAGDIIGIMIKRSMEMIIGIFGILKTGGAYLPIDPDYPQERIDYILKDSGTKILIVKSEIRISKFETNPNDQNTNDQNKNRNLGIPFVLNFENLNFEFVSSFGFRASDLIPSNLAYIIYTSGSTGRPKGVIVEHPAVINLLFALFENYPCKETDCYLLKTTYVFDVSVAELFGWFLGGGRLAILEPGGEKEPKAIIKAVESSYVTHINFVPTMFNVFLDTLTPRDMGSLRSLRYIFLAGEAVMPELVRKFKQLDTGISLENLYGPTESTVYASGYSLNGWSGGGVVPIGRPLQNIELYIWNKYKQLQPVGIPGELCISGVGLAVGYLNRPELTEQKFLGVQGPFYKKVPGRRRLYRTGDLARWLGSGDIEFLGRIDQQVKVRGFRIELGEIETRLLEYSGIKEAVVILMEDKQGTQGNLCAYFTSDRQIPVAELREYLAVGLPNYMIPAYFVPLEKIPLTGNGKIDRKSLPAPGSFVLLSQGEIIKPVSDTEKIIAGIWKEVLNLDKSGDLGMDVNFFEIGGNSLNIINVNRRINQVFEKELPVMEMFRYTTIRSLARFLGGPRVEKEEEVIGKRKERKPGTDIAVIGMAGRFPGARNTHEFWENLKNGVESITFFSDLELEEAGVKPDLIKDPSYVKANGILADFDNFDAGFFSYSPREAGIMDPQMRIFHECTWSALEASGYNPNTYDGAIGLYAGAMHNFEWETRVRLSGKSGVLGDFAAWQLMNKDFLSMRVSYKLNLKGPAVLVQTSCSTSLAAIHIACRALLDGECDMALAGGVSVTLFEKSGYLYREGMILSPDGHCRPFDAKARGTVVGNGVGVVVLKPLENAVNDGDHIYALVKGSAVNNDGVRKVGFTAPSIDGQAEAIRAAQQAAGVEPETIGYIEAHGTATELGDPVEIQALKLAFNTDKKKYCAIGSVKSNMGHLDAAAGVTGFIKTVLTLYHRLIPPSLHFEMPNPKIDFDNSPFYVNAGLRPWPSEKYPRRAGVSSFGLGGTNVHAILEEYKIASGGQEPFYKKVSGLPKIFYYLIPLSAKTQSALDKQTQNLADYLKDNPRLSLADAAYTLQVGRETFDYRKILVCTDTLDAAADLSTPDSTQIHTFFNRETGPRPVVFMFPGQGSQYLNMALELYQSEPVFRLQMDHCFKTLQPLTGYDFKQVLYPSFEEDNNGSYRTNRTNIIDQTQITQPLVFSIEYALAKTLMAWGIQPHAMIGHSIGEYVAACLAGVFSLDNALEIVALRGRLMKQMPGGAMLSVSLPENELAMILQNYPEDQVSLAAVNSTSLCTVSGPHDAIAAFARQLQEKGIQSRPLHTSHAFHSAMMDPILETFETKIRRTPLNPPTMPYLSNLTGQWITVAQALDPHYWSSHLRKNVRFNDGLRELMKIEKAVLIEVGPGNALSTFARKHQAKQPGQIIINLLRHPQEDIPDQHFLLTQIGRLWLYNVPIRWQAYYDRFDDGKPHRIPLPTYPFAPIRYPAEKGLASLDADTIAKISQKQTRLPQRKKDPADWFYVPQWTRSTLPPQPRTGKTGTRLIFMDGAGLGTLLVKELEKDQQELILVEIGKEFSKTKTENTPDTPHTRYTLDPERQEHYDALFRELQATGGIPTWIIHLWNVTGNQAAGAQRSGDALELSFHSLIWLAQSIGKAGFTHEIHIDVITDNMHEVIGGDGVCPQKTVALGPVKVIPREYPNILCRCIDIQWPQNEIEQLLTELASDSGDPVMALRGKYRWIQTLEPLRLEKPGPPPLKEKGVYLVTGGLGGLGLTLAEHLVKKVRARVILVGRSQFPAPDQWPQWLEEHDEAHPISRKIQKIRELQTLGGEIAIYSADVADEEQMPAVLRQSLERFGHIDGVIHAAGVADGAMIQRRTRRDSDAVLAPKVKGTLLLDTLLKDQSLDFFVLCSSLASFSAPFGQVAYCSANAFLDAFALYKNSRPGGAGTVTTSINWGSWQQVGMAVEAVKQLEKGIAISLEEEITPAQGAAAFDQIIASRLPQVAVSVRELPLKTSDLMKKESEAHEDASSISLAEKEPDREAGAFHRPDLSTGYIEPGDPLEKTLAAVLQEFLGIEKVGIDDNFFELGISSLDLVQIAGKLKEMLKKEIPVVTLFTHSTVRALAQFIQPKQDAGKKEEEDSNRDSETENLLENTMDLLGT